jgi:EAL domain-containing protein (putative c-di-GMP-specific phosphodiesterase class I)
MVVSDGGSRAVVSPLLARVADIVVAAQQLGPRSAIHAVVAVARTSGATVIAEAIEGERKAELMAAMVVDHGQGWWLGRPEHLSS